MKPQSQISRHLKSNRHQDMVGGLRPNYPAIDFHYRATGADFRAASKRLQPSLASFRHLSNEFLGGESKRDYLAEAICFLIIVSVSAWPIVSMVQALSLLK